MLESVHSAAKGGKASNLGYTSQRWSGSFEAAGETQVILSSWYIGAYSLFVLAGQNAIDADVQVTIRPIYSFGGTPQDVVTGAPVLTVLDATLAPTSGQVVLSPVELPELAGAFAWEVSVTVGANTGGTFVLELVAKS